MAVLKRRKAGDAALIDGKFFDLRKPNSHSSVEVLIAFKSIVDHMEFSEATVTEFEFRIPNSNPFLNLKICQCLTRSENIEPSPVSFHFSPDLRN